MTPEELKKSILQLAIQGKLVEQRPEEGTAEYLYTRIQEEKQRLIKEGKIKKEKPLPEITDDEIPFDIPDSWKWVKLGEIVTVLGGKRIPAGRKLTTENTGHIYIRVSDMKKSTVLLDNLLYVPEDIYPSISRYIIRKDDVYITVAGTIGTVGTIPDVLDGANLTENANRLVFTILDKIWLTKCLQSSVVQNQIADATTKVGQPKLAIKRIQEFLIPLPPLKEQKRIVAKIEELLPLVDKYADAYNRLEELNKTFPSDLKKSILQYAIQGKLVEQRPEEGTADDLYAQIQAEKQRLIKEGKIKKEKPLPAITDDEIPFDIPDSWKWVRFGSCGTFVRGSGIKKDETVLTGYPCIRYGQLYTKYRTSFESVDTYIPNDIFDKCVKINHGDIVMALTGENNFDIALAATYLGSDVVAIGGDMTKFTSYHINPMYLVYVMNSGYGINCKSKLATGNIIVHISNDKLAGIPIPLPPLKEQNRIVEAIKKTLLVMEAFYGN